MLDIVPQVTEALFIVLKILSQNCGHIRNIRCWLVSPMAFRSSIFNKTLLTKAQWSNAMWYSHLGPGTEKDIGEKTNDIHMKSGVQFSVCRHGLLGFDKGHMIVDSDDPRATG